MSIRIENGKKIITKTAGVIDPSSDSDHAEADSDHGKKGNKVHLDGKLNKDCQGIYIMH